MPGSLIIFYIHITCLAGLLISVHICSAQDAAPPKIPKARIAVLEADLSKNDKTTSSVRKRRACKTVVRDAEDLLESYPEAPNRHQVLEIMLQTQKRLLSLESSDRNRDVLFDICERLVKAPDDYADLRLEADLLLSERELSLKNADVKTRAEALAGVAAALPRHTGRSEESQDRLADRPETGCRRTGERNHPCAGRTIFG